MATADPLTAQLWDELPSAGANYAPPKGRKSGIADPEGWRKDGSLEQLARAFADDCMCPFGLIKKTALGAAKKALTECKGDLGGILAALSRKRRDRWFVQTAENSTPFFVATQVVMEWARAIGDQDKPELLADCRTRAAFSDEQWRRMLPINRRSIIAEETGRDLNEVEDNVNYGCAGLRAEV